VRFRFSGSGAIYKWELEVDGRDVEYELSGNLTISDSLFSVEAALEGIGLAFTFAARASPRPNQEIEARFDRLLANVSGVLPVLSQPAQQPPKLKAFVDYAQAYFRKRASQ
jgi:DNA-binding transcriptional LysR family regulator